MSKGAIYRIRNDSMTSPGDHPCMGDSLQNLGTWSSHSLQGAQQVGECPLQMAQLVWAFSRQLGRSGPLLGNSVCLRFSHSHPCCLAMVVEGRSECFCSVSETSRSLWVVYSLDFRSFCIGGNVSPPLRILCCWTFSNILCLYKLPAPKTEVLLSEGTYTAHTNTRLNSEAH